MVNPHMRDVQMMCVWKARLFSGRLNRLFFVCPGLRLASRASRRSPLIRKNLHCFVWTTSAENYDATANAWLPRLHDDAPLDFRRWEILRPRGDNRICISASTKPFAPHTHRTGGTNANRKRNRSFAYRKRIDFSESEHVKGTQCAYLAIKLDTLNVDTIESLGFNVEHITLVQKISLSAAQNEAEAMITHVRVIA